MSEKLQYNKGQLDLPTPTEYSMQWFLLNGWDKPEKGLSLDKGAICRAVFILLISVGTALIPYTVAIIKAGNPALRQ